MATPILTDLRRRYPHAEITAMCTRALAPLLEHDPDIDELFSFSRQSGWEKKDSLRSIVSKIHAGKYDLGILLTNSISSAWWFWRGRVKKRIGYRKDGRRIFLSRALSYPENIENQHLVTTYKMLLEPLGVKISDTDPRIHLTNEELDQAETILANQGVPSKRKLVGINPGAAYGSAKCWPPERFRAVIEKLLEDPQVYIVCFGDANGAPTVKQIVSGLPQRVINLAGGTTLRELCCLIKKCDAFLTNDSGPMHIASALQTPLVAIFGSTSEIKTGPYKNGTVIHKHVECSPCYLRECPIDFRCMKRISPEEVYDLIKDLI